VDIPSPSFVATLELDDYLQAHHNSQAGLMIRQSLDPDSPYSFLFVSGLNDGTLGAKYRTVSGVPFKQCNLSPNSLRPTHRLSGVRLIIEKNRDMITASWITLDGLFYGSCSHSITFPSNDVHVGIAVSSPLQGTTLVVKQLKLAIRPDLSVILKPFENPIDPTPGSYFEYNANDFESVFGDVPTERGRMYSAQLMRNGVLIHSGSFTVWSAKGNAYGTSTFFRSTSFKTGDQLVPMSLPSFQGYLPEVPLEIKSDHLVFVEAAWKEAYGDAPIEDSTYPVWFLNENSAVILVANVLISHEASLGWFVQPSSDDDSAILLQHPQDLSLAFPIPQSAQTTRPISITTNKLLATKKDNDHEMVDRKSRRLDSSLSSMVPHFFAHFHLKVNAPLLSIDIDGNLGMASSNSCGSSDTITDKFLGSLKNSFAASELGNTEECDVAVQLFGSATSSITLALPDFPDVDDLKLGPVTVASSIDFSRNYNGNKLHEKARFQFYAASQQSLKTIRGFVQGTIPILGDWLSETIDMFGTSPEVTFIYVNDKGSHQFGFIGEFSIPEDSCPDWIGQLEVAVELIQDQQLTELYNFVKILCAASQIEISFYTKGASVDITRTYLRLGRIRLTLDQIMVAGMNLENNEACALDMQCQSNLCAIENLDSIWDSLVILRCAPRRERGDPCNALLNQCLETLDCKPTADGISASPFYSCDGAPRPNGAGCSHNVHCNSGRCVIGLLPLLTNSCEAKLPLNADCIFDEDCLSDFCNGIGIEVLDQQIGQERICKQKRKAGQGCAQDNDCANGLTCDAKTKLFIPGFGLGLSKSCGGEPLENGWFCVSDDDCESGRCPLSRLNCENKLENGDFCIEDSDCESSFCNGPVWDRECKPKRKMGEPCLENDDCENYAGDCKFISGSILRTCNGDRMKNGLGCSLDNDCESRYCSWGFDCARKRNKNEQCWEHEDCEHGLYCGWGVPLKCEGKRRNGSGCSRDYQCKSGNCHFDWGWEC